MKSNVKEYAISLTRFKICFRKIYGDTPYSYLKTYRMNLASGLLLEDNRIIKAFIGQRGFQAYDVAVSGAGNRSCTNKSYKRGEAKNRCCKPAVN